MWKISQRRNSIPPASVPWTHAVIPIVWPAYASQSAASLLTQHSKYYSFEPPTYACVWISVMSFLYVLHICPTCLVRELTKDLFYFSYTLVYVTTSKTMNMVCKIVQNIKNITFDSWKYMFSNYKIVRKHVFWIIK